MTDWAGPEGGRTICAADRPTDAVSSPVMAEPRPILICAVYRANSPVVPMSITRRCEKCCCLVMTSPSSQPLIDSGARVYCATCGEAEAPVDRQYEMLPGQLDELTQLGGPLVAIAAAMAIDLANDHARRGRN